MKPQSIDEYLAAVKDDQRVALQALRGTIREAAPDVEECISYGLATFKLRGKGLVAVGATPNHCAFHLMSNSIVNAHQDELKGWETSTGTVRFQPDRPLPAALVRRLVAARITENGV